MTGSGKSVRADRNKLALISGVELFSTLLDDDLAYVASRTGFRRISEGTSLFQAGDTAKEFFIVKTGTVAITTPPSPKGSQELARYVPGDVFGDFHFVISGEYNAAARAIEDTELLVFPGDGFSFERLCEEKPDTASRILLKSISMIESRLRSTRKLIAENAPWIRELRKQIFIDPATGLWNRSFLDSELPHLLSGTVAVLMFKPDNFKELNDTLGHVAGDEILRRMAELVIAEATRGRGWAIRLRSNEMCLIMPVTGDTDAIDAARKIQLSLADAVPFEKFHVRFLLTASAALGIWPDDDKNLQRVTELTNDAMLQVWKNGGNRLALLKESAQ